MTLAHNRGTMALVRQLLPQVDEDRFDIRTNAGHIRIAADRYFVADVAVIPKTAADSWLDRPYELEEYNKPLPLVIEVWSRSTGGYDVETKFPAYRLRGDLEIWRFQPYEHRVTIWRRQADGSYSESEHRGGSVAVASLPGVRIDLDRAFRGLTLGPTG